MIAERSHSDIQPIERAKRRATLIIPVAAASFMKFRRVVMRLLTLPGLCNWLGVLASHFKQMNEKQLDPCG